MAHVNVKVDGGFIDHILDPFKAAKNDETVYLFVNSETNMRIGVPESAVEDFNVSDTRDHGIYMIVGEFQERYQQLVEAGVKVI